MIYNNIKLNNKFVFCFKDFILSKIYEGNNLENIDIMNKMSIYISRRFKDEDKIIFTYWIGKIFNFTKFLFISKIEMSEEWKDVKHVFVILGDKYYDGSGFHTREDIYKQFHISKWSFNDYTFSGNLEDFSKCVEQKKLKLSDKLELELKTILQKYKDMK
jgi:hypothetical protein